MNISRSFASVLLVAAFAAGAPLAASAAEKPLSQRVADSALNHWPDGRFEPAPAPLAWNYALGTLLEGMDSVWQNTVDPRYFHYIQDSVDKLLAPDGSIPTLNPEEDQLDNILLGRQLLFLYGYTQNKRYYTAATQLYKSLDSQPRTASGGFWHKQRYPNQMWLDGLYMAEPFRAEYAATFHHPQDFSDITLQFALIHQHLQNPKTGLLLHAWDESKQQPWADKQTGVSGQYWGRGMGWVMMALVDTLPYYPEYSAGRKQLLDLLAHDAAAITRAQDPKTGLWFQVLDKPTAKGNYLESSAASMFVYALAKGVRLGYLPQSYLAAADRGYKGIQSHFLQTSPDGSVSLTGTVKGVGLGGSPYRDGTYEYYVGEKVVTDDPKGVGAFLLAATEMETAQNAKLGRGKTVMMDAWFNSQKRPDATGQQIYFHYKWDDLAPSGFSLFAHQWQNYGATLKTLYVAPTVQNLHDAQVYIIASPDIPAKNPNPHYAVAEDGTQIADWVRAGGVLLILENDTSFADLDHFNVVSEKFGIHFNSILRKHVEGTNWAQGKIEIPAGGPVFQHSHTIYTKDVCTISVSGPAKSILSEGDDTFFATAKYGKGTVYAMVDPWLYNEYTDGRKLPPMYDNLAGGEELVRWALKQVPAKTAVTVPQDAAKSPTKP